MNQQFEKFVDAFLYALLHFRLQSADSRGHYQDWSAFGRLQGRLGLAQDLNLITREQYRLLSDLIQNAVDYKGEPFPSEYNAGPVIPWFESHKRHLAEIQLGKPQAVPACEPEQLQPVTARPQLRLLCLLVKGRDGQARTLLVHTMRPLPPSSCPTRIPGQNALRRWCLDPSGLPNPGNSGLLLRDAQAQRPPAQVLERISKHRQANPVRTAARTVLTAGASA